MIAGINELKTLTKHISCEINGGIMININATVKSDMYVKKMMLGILPHVVLKNGKYLASIVDDSANRCDEVIESHDKETETIPTNFNEKKAFSKTQIFYILLI